jgi:hypothetical protein
LLPFLGSKLTEDMYSTGKSIEDSAPLGSKANSTDHGIHGKDGENGTGIVVGIVVGIVLLLIIVALGIAYWNWKRHRISAGPLVKGRKFHESDDSVEIQLILDADGKRKLVGK